MSHPKYQSEVLARAAVRVQVLEEIDAKMDFGNGASLKALVVVKDELEKSVNDYNAMSAAAGAARSEIAQNEARASDLLERTLSGVLTRYGKDSKEYKHAGGTPKSERKRPGKKKQQVEKRKARKSNAATASSTEEGAGAGAADPRPAPPAAPATTGGNGVGQHS